MLHCVLFNQRNIQILDVRHRPIKTFVSGLSLQFPPIPALLLRKAWYSGYLSVSVGAFHKFTATKVEHCHLDWEDLKYVQIHTTTFFGHSDLRTRNETSCPNSASASSGNNQHAVPPTVPEPCRTWNYTSACNCDEQDAAAYKKQHRCRVCEADDPDYILLCTLTHPQWAILNTNDLFDLEWTWTWIFQHLS